MKAQQLDYEFNPYTYARICTMKSLILKKEDYEKMLKMDPHEIIKFLQEGVYKDDINAYAMKFSGIKLVEKALYHHLEKMFNKLRIISDPDIQVLLNQYLKRYDFYNIKTLLRAKQTKLWEEDAVDLLMPLGSMTMDFMKRQYRKENARQILTSCPVIEIKPFKDAIDRYENSKDLSEIENLLDFSYYNDTKAFVDNVPEEGALYRDFFLYELDIYNIKIILMKIFFKLTRQDIEKFIVNRGKELSKFRKMPEISNMSELLAFLEKSSYGKIMRGIKEDAADPLLSYEVALDHFLLKRSIMLYHKNPLSADIIFGYMFAQEIETKNIRTIIKTKKLEYTEDYAKKLIII